MKRGSGTFSHRFSAGSILLIVAIGFLAPMAHANICIVNTLRVRNVHGRVTDQLGEGVAGAKIELKLPGDGNLIATTEGESDGKFELRVPRGQYELIVTAPGFEVGVALLKKGIGVKNWFHPDFVLAILGVGSLDCPPEFTTNNREFMRGIRKFRAEVDRSSGKDADQK
ncbi:MAG TPA: carboxypeptidase-like regulatory domain-containing protein [Terracidiphilus sp.]